MKRPSFQFYPADWRNDAGLRMCSMAARGLWIEMMCLMHVCERYGFLEVGGKSVSPRDLSRMIYEPVKTINRLLGELELNGVLSRDQNGIIYSRRMVRDEKERDGWRERQAKSRATPENVTADVTVNVTPKSQPSSSSTSSPSSPTVQEVSSLRSDCPEPSQAQASVPEPAAVECPKFLLRPQPQKPQSPTFIELETNLEGKTFTITEAHVAQFSGLYPGVDVRQELRGMKGWLFSNPAQRKTAKGMLRFVNGWLDREQNKPKPKPKAGSARPSFSDPDQFKIINPLEQMQ